MHPRSRARQLALQVLYLCEARAPGADKPLLELAGLQGNEKQAARYLIRQFEELNVMEELEETEELPEADDEEPAAPRELYPKNERRASVDMGTQLVLGVLDERRTLDETIGQAAENWSVARMAVVDRNVLRVAAYELLFDAEVPERVAINEGVELAKRFGTSESGAFVNGILDKIRRQMQE